MNKLTSFLIEELFVVGKRVLDLYETWIKYFNEDLLEGLKVE